MVPKIRQRRRPTSLGLEVAAAPATIGHNRPTGVEVQVEHIPVERLQLPARELRKHSNKQITQIAASIREFGNINPIVVGAGNRIISGVGRYLAAKELKLSRVPVIDADHLSAEQQRAYAVADNRLGELSSWDTDLLAVELVELSDLPGLEIELTGFEGAELDAIVLGVQAVDAAAESEEVEEPAADAVAISRPGDLFQIGDHRLLCGNARERASYEALLGEERATMVFADLPYNVVIARNVSGLGRVKHGEFVEGSGEMNRSEFTAFMSDIFSNIVAYSVDGSIHFQCMDWRHQIEMMQAGEQHYRELKNLLVWVKTNGGMSTFYRSQHELIYAWKSGKAPHINNFGLGEKGRYRTNVLRYPGCNTFRKGRDEDLEAHSTVKPTALVADLIRDVSNLGDIVLDPTSGSGTTILAAERVKRRARCIELDPKYVDVAIRRAKTRLGLEAIHIETGLTFDQLAGARSEADDEGEDA